MNNVFIVLLLLSVAFLVWGLISPVSLSKKTSRSFSRKHLGLMFGAFSLMFFVLVGITAPPQPKQEKKVEFTNTSAKSAEAPKQAKPTPKPTPAPKPKKVAPKITTKLVTETQVVPFQATTVNSSSLSKGTTKVTTAGVNGEITRTYTVTYKDGVQTGKKLKSEVVSKQPVTQVTTVGTKVVVAPVTPAPAPAPKSNCDPNYSGACVPIASDVDCAGGSGNGPAYVSGPVTVIGIDIYDLDRDGNGTGCE